MTLTKVQLVDSVGEMLIALADRSREVYGEAVAAEGLTELQWLLLRRLRAEGEPPVIGALARWLGTEPPTVTALVDRLERRSLLERRLDPGDRRRKRIALTPAGHEALSRVDARAAPQTPCRDLTRKQLLELRALLAEMIEPEFTRSQPGK